MIVQAEVHQIKFQITVSPSCLSSCPYSLQRQLEHGSITQSNTSMVGIFQSVTTLKNGIITGETEGNMEVPRT